LGLALVLLLSATAASAQSSDCNQQQSRQEVDRLTAAGTIVSIDQFLPSITAVVQLRQWAHLSLDDKTRLARNVDCAIAGANNTMLRTVIVRAPDTQELGRYADNQLTILKPMLPPARNGPNVAVQPSAPPDRQPCVPGASPAANLIAQLFGGCVPPAGKPSGQPQ
jgi:hypothetical protein